jgi:hypothetical protein
MFGTYTQKSVVKPGLGREVMNHGRMYDRLI